MSVEIDNLWAPLTADAELMKALPRSVVETAIGEQVVRQGPWSAAMRAILLAQQGGIVGHLKKTNAEKYEFGDRVTRRYNIATVMLASAWGAARLHERVIPQPDKWATVVMGGVESANKLVEGLREWAASARDERHTPAMAEIEAVIPLVCLWQTIGPLVREWTAREVPLSIPERNSLVRALEFTQRRLPEAAPRYWADPKVQRVFPVPTGLRVETWVGNGVFALDQVQNPWLLGSRWSEKFANEPSFVAAGNIMESIAQFAPRLLRLAGEGVDGVSATGAACLRNLADPASVYHARKYFAANISYLPALTDRKGLPGPNAGVDKFSPLRARAMRNICSTWMSEMQKLGRPLTEQHKQRLVQVSRYFDAESWRMISAPATSPAVALSARDVLLGPSPWGDKGLIEVLNQLSPWLKIRRDIIQVITEAETSPGGAVDVSRSQERWRTRSQRTLEDALGHLYELGLVHRKSPPSAEIVGDYDATTSANFWRGFFTKQANPWVALADPAKSVLGMSGFAYYHQLRLVIGSLWKGADLGNQVDAVKRSSLQEQLAHGIWQAAAKRAATNDRLSLEEAMFAGAIEVAHNPQLLQALAPVGGFSIEQAYAVTFGTAMGSFNPVRLVDGSEAAQRIRGEVLKHDVTLTDALIAGRAAIVAQVLVDWRKLGAKEAVSADPRVGAISEGLSDLQRANQDLGGNTSLGALLLKPEIWAKIVPPSSAREKFLSEVAANVRATPVDVLKSQSPVGAENPVLADPSGVATALKRVGNAQSFVMGSRESNIVESRPKERHSLDWQSAVVASAVSGMTKLLDLMASGEQARVGINPEFSQVTMIDALWKEATAPAANEQWRAFYARTIDSKKEQFPMFNLGPTRSEVPTGAVSSALVDRFLAQEARMDQGPLAQLTREATMMSAEKCEALRLTLLRAFTPFSDGALRSHQQCAVWNLALAGALKSLKETGTIVSSEKVDRLAHACEVFRQVDDRQHRKSYVRGEQTVVRDMKEVDRQYGKGALELRDALSVPGAISPDLAWMMRAQVLDIVHATFAVHAKSLERVSANPGSALAGISTVFGLLIGGVQNILNQAELAVSRGRIGPELSEKAKGPESTGPVREQRDISTEIPLLP